MDRIDKHKLLMEAYIDADFQSELKSIRDKIRNDFEEFAKKIGRFCERIDNIFSFEARVKTADSFEEKIYRKNYIDKWKINSDKKVNQNMIKHNLTDIIGIRINCYYYQFEERLYNAFQKESQAFVDKGYKLDFTENTKQKNGHDIYKFSGVYDGQYHFEIQIKSVIHNVWGETEHKTVYKNLSYDGYIKEKKTITNSLYSILRSSEEQLFSLFSMEETEDQLLRSLFFCYTKNEVSTACKTRILAYHYENFFRAFNNQTEVKSFVIAKLTGVEYKKTDIAISHQCDDKLDLLKEKFPFFYLECLYNIDSVLHNHESFESFLSYFLESVFIVEDEDEFDKEYGVGIVDDEEKEYSSQTNDIAVINEVLGDIIKM